jgi:hypothetical protein
VLGGTRIVEIEASRVEQATPQVEELLAEIRPEIALLVKNTVDRQNVAELIERYRSGETGPLLEFAHRWFHERAAARYGHVPGISTSNVGQVAITRLLEHLQKKPNFRLAADTFFGFCMLLLTQSYAAEFKSLRRSRVKPDPALLGKLGWMTGFESSASPAELLGEWGELHQRFALLVEQGKIKPAEEVAFRLWFYDGKDTSEIARVLLVSTRMASRYRYRAIQKLAPYLKNWLELMKT